MPDAPSYATGLKTPSPEQPAYHKRQDSAQNSFQNPRSSQAPFNSFSMATASYPQPVDQQHMTPQRGSMLMQPMHQHGMVQTPYMPEDHMRHRTHAAHSSVSSAASVPSFYSHYTPQQTLPNNMHFAGQSVPLSSYSYLPNIGAVNAAVSSAGALNAVVNSSPATVSSVNGSGSSLGNGEVFDTTGQSQPPGAKLKVSVCLWEDETTHCIQIESKGISVARRDDNNMINGTKLLNVAGMTRGRRDGILKSEKARVVVKIGPMHLKGVWIPYDRALEFANKEKITDQLWPLFVQNLSSVVVGPSGMNGGEGYSRVSATNPNRMRPEDVGDYFRGPATSQSGLQHSMPSSIVASGTTTPYAHPSLARPNLERAQTFPTPPTSANGPLPVSTYQQWSDAPATSGAMPQSLLSSSPYDSSRSFGHSSHPSYGSSYGGMARFGQNAKSEMGPPARTAQIPDDRYAPQMQSNNSSSEVGDGDHDADYTHTAGSYVQTRPGFGYPTQHQTPDQHASPQLSASPTKSATIPRTATQYGAYPQRPTPIPNALYHVLNEPQHMNNGSDLPYSTYGQTYSQPTSNKRGLDYDDDEQTNDIKRQRTNNFDENSRPVLAHQKR